MIHQVAKRFLWVTLISVASGALPAVADPPGAWPARAANAPALNDGRSIGGDFRIDGVPREYQPLRTYPITVVIAQPGQSLWGFQLTTQFAHSGGQAGTLAARDGMARVTSESAIQYARHTEEGSRSGTKDGPVAFYLNWTAPESANDLVIFSATGRAADPAHGVIGDFAYTAGSFSRPAGNIAQQPEPVQVEEVKATESGRMRETSRIVNLPAPVDLKRGSMEIMIQHRFLESIDRAGAGGAFGIDSGANISLGINYALTDRVSAGVARTRFDKIVELSGTYEIHTAEESKWKLSLRGGVEGADNFHEHYAPFVQLPGSVDIGRVRLNVVPSMVFNSRRDELLEFDRGRVINPDSNDTFSLGLGTDIMLTRRLSLTGEYVPRLAGFGGLDRRRDQVAGGIIVRTWGHVFTIIVSTSRDFTPSKYGVNAEDRSLSLGFNLYRTIH